MSEALEPQQKTNPQGDPITSVSAPKAEAKKDPHADAKRQKIVTPEYMFLGRKSLLRGVRQRKRPSVVLTSILPLHIPSRRKAKRCSW